MHGDAQLYSQTRTGNTIYFKPIEEFISVDFEIERQEREIDD